MVKIHALIQFHFKRADFLSINPDETIIDMMEKSPRDFEIIRSTIELYPNRYLDGELARVDHADWNKVVIIRRNKYTNVVSFEEIVDDIIPGLAQLWEDPQLWENPRLDDSNFYSLDQTGVISKENFESIQDMKKYLLDTLKPGQSMKELSTFVVYQKDYEGKILISSRDDLILGDHGRKAYISTLYANGMKRGDVVIDSNQEYMILDDTHGIPLWVAKSRGTRPIIPPEFTVDNVVFSEWHWKYVIPQYLFWIDIRSDFKAIDDKYLIGCLYVFSHLSKPTVVYSRFVSDFRRLMRTGGGKLLVRYKDDLYWSAAIMENGKIST